MVVSGDLVAEATGGGGGGGKNYTDTKNVCGLTYVTVL